MKQAGYSLTFPAAQATVVLVLFTVAGFFVTALPRRSAGELPETRLPANAYATRTTTVSAPPVQLQQVRGDEITSSTITRSTMERPGEAENRGYSDRVKPCSFVTQPLVTRSYVPETGGLQPAAERVRTRYAANPDVKVAVAPHSGRIVVIAPLSIHREITQQVTTNRLVNCSARQPLRTGDEMPPTHTGIGYLHELQHVSWRELEDMLFSAGASRQLGPDGLVSTFQLTGPSHAEATLELNRSNNEAILRGSAAHVRAWTQVLQALDQPAGASSAASTPRQSDHNAGPLSEQTVKRLLASSQPKKPALASVVQSLLHQRVQDDELRSAMPTAAQLGPGGSESPIDEDQLLERLAETSTRPQLLSIESRSVATSVADEDEAGVDDHLQTACGLATMTSGATTDSSSPAGDPPTDHVVAELDYLVPLVSFGIGFMCSLAFAAMVLPSVIWRQGKTRADDHQNQLWADIRVALLRLTAGEPRHRAEHDDASAWPSNPQQEATWFSSTDNVGCDDKRPGGLSSAMLERVFEQNLELRGCASAKSDDFAYGQPTEESFDEPPTSHN